MNKLKLKNYSPHEGQQAFHYSIAHLFRYVAMICGIRGGKTYAGAREAGRQAWNASGDGVFGIVAPTYSMLKRTTWEAFKDAVRPLIAKNGINDSDFIITLRNGRQVHGHTAEKPDRIRNETFTGVWGDEAREWKDFASVWKILLGRVLSTGGKIFITTSPNSFDDIHETFIANKRSEEYGTVRFSTYENQFIGKEEIDALASQYDTKYAEQELGGQFVIFEGAVYYTFNRTVNAGDYAFRIAQYDPNKPIWLCCDFNIDPMAWVITQPSINQDGLKQVLAVDEIFLRNSNTLDCCNEFKTRFPNHRAGIVLYGDATGKARHTSSNITNWKIIEDELRGYGITSRVPLSNPAERDRINAVNGMLKNSKGVNRVFINPDKCKHLIRDLEQVPYKEGTTQIDKTKDLLLTHPSDAFGYMVETEFSLNRMRVQGLKI